MNEHTQAASAASPRPRAESAPSERDDFLHGICVALQVVTAGDCAVTWGEIVTTVGVEEMLDYATFVSPEDWELAGFKRYARSELGRAKPRRRLASAASEARA